VPRRGLRVPTGLLGLEGNDQGRGDRRGEAETLASTMAGRRDVSGLGPAGGCHRWLVRVLAMYAGACACSEAQAQEREASARGCAATWRTDAERFGGAAGVATTCDGLRVRARERLHERINDPALAPSGGTKTTGGTGRLNSPWQNAGELGSVVEHKDKGMGLNPSQANACSCAGARICTWVSTCAHRGHVHGDGRDIGGDATFGETQAAERGRKAG
jgi:hypothetical protein